MFDGWCASQNLDPLDLPYDRFLSLVYYWATRNMDEDDRQKFDARLWRPPKGEIAVGGPWTAEAETNAFKALKAQLAPAPPPGGDAAPVTQARNPAPPRSARARNQQARPVAPNR